MSFEIADIFRLNKQKLKLLPHIHCVVPGGGFSRKIFKLY